MRVLLQIEYVRLSFLPVRVGGDSSFHSSLGPRPRSVSARIHDPDLVQIAVRRAQLAILNPSILLYRFLEYDIPAEPETNPLGSTRKLAFSNDVIVLEITGPQVTDLTLVDLPGLIQNVGEGEDKNNIQLVEDMVKSYISKDCLILLVITMKGQVEHLARLTK